MLKYMLDTDMVSYALRGVGSVGARLLAHKPSELCVSALTLAELRFGAARSRSRKLHRLIDTFMASMTVAPFDEAAAARFGEVGAELLQQGEPIGQIDTLIAAHALSLELTLVSHNTRHFARVRGLRLESWA